MCNALFQVNETGRPSTPGASRPVPGKWTTKKQDGHGTFQRWQALEGAGGTVLDGALRESLSEEVPGAEI